MYVCTLLFYLSPLILVYIFSLLSCKFFSQRFLITEYVRAKKRSHAQLNAHNLWLLLSLVATQTAGQAHSNSNDNATLTIALSLSLGFFLSFATYSVSISSPSYFLILR